MSKPIRICRGNTFALKLDVEKLHVKGGSIVKEDFDLEKCKEVKVLLYSKGKTTEAEFEVEGKSLFIIGNGQYEVGMYDLELVCVAEDNSDLLFSQPSVISIVKNTKETDVPCGVEFNVDLFYLGVVAVSVYGKNGEKGEKGDQGEQGIQGERGIQGEKGEKGDKGDAFTYDDFTPEQIEALKIKGDKGDQGEQGIQGERGERGLQGIQGEKGEKGTNGVSCEAHFEGTTLVVSSVSGTTSADLKGERGIQGVQGIQGIKGDKGDQGEQGIQGERGERGLQGIQGEKGAKGDSPVKGIDYWTEADKQEILSEATAEIVNPIVYKGTLGVGGTITSLPPASEENHGYQYKVITAGIYNGISANVGDSFISNGASWGYYKIGELVGTTSADVLDINTHAPLANTLYDLNCDGIFLPKERVTRFASTSTSAYWVPIYLNSFLNIGEEYKLIFDLGEDASSNVPIAYYSLDGLKENIVSVPKGKRYASLIYTPQEVTRGFYFKLPVAMNHGQQIAVNVFTHEDVSAMKFSEVESLLKQDSEILPNMDGYIVIEGLDSVVDVNDVKEPTANLYHHTIVDCKPGDRFIISANSSVKKSDTYVSFSKAFAFLDSENKVITHHIGDIHNLLISAPINASKLVINKRKDARISIQCNNNKIYQFDADIEELEEQVSDTRLIPYRSAIARRSIGGVFWKYCPCEIQSGHTYLVTIVANFICGAININSRATATGGVVIDRIGTIPTSTDLRKEFKVLFSATNSANSICLESVDDIEFTISVYEDIIDKYQGEIKAIDASIQSLSEKVDELTPSDIIINEGTIVNSADEQDITADSVTNALSFKNRKNIGKAYGCVFLRQDKSFASQVTFPDTMYIVRYDYNLLGQDIKLPNNTIIVMQGGGIHNGRLMNVHRVIGNGETICPLVVSRYYESDNPEPIPSWGTDRCVEGVIIDCNFTYPIALEIGNHEYGTYRNVSCRNFTKYGVWVAEAAFECIMDSIECISSNSSSAPDPDYENYGLFVQNSDGIYSNIIIKGCYCGIKCYGSNSLFKDIHMWGYHGNRIGFWVNAESVLVNQLYVDSVKAQDYTKNCLELVNGKRNGGIGVLLEKATGCSFSDILFYGNSKPNEAKIRTHGFYAFPDANINGLSISNAKYMYLKRDQFIKLPTNASSQVYTIRDVVWNGKFNDNPDEGYTILDNELLPL